MLHDCSQNTTLDGKLINCSPFHTQLKESKVLYMSIKKFCLVIVILIITIRIFIVHVMHFLAIWEVQKIANCMANRHHTNGEAQPIELSNEDQQKATQTFKSTSHVTCIHCVKNYTKYSKSSCTFLFFLCYSLWNLNVSLCSTHSTY